MEKEKDNLFQCELCLKRYVTDKLITEDTTCETCEKNKQEGVIFLTYSMKVGEEVIRSGGYFVVAEEGVRRFFGDMSEEMIKRRVVYISDQDAIKLGFNKFFHQEDISEDLVPGLDE